MTAESITKVKVDHSLKDLLEQIERVYGMDIHALGEEIDLAKLQRYLRVVRAQNETQIQSDDDSIEEVAQKIVEQMARYGV